MPIKFGELSDAQAFVWRNAGLSFCPQLKQLSGPNGGLFRIEAGVQIVHGQVGPMANRPKTGESKGVGGGREESGEPKSRRKPGKRLEASATHRRVGEGKRHKRADSPRNGDVQEELPRSVGIDWVAETGRVEELPSEELRLPDARRDDFREMIGEEVLINATSGDDAGEEIHEEVVPEEVGGPFVETTAEVELASGSDEANPPDAEAEPLPRVISETPDLPPS